MQLFLLKIYHEGAKTQSLIHLKHKINNLISA